MQDSTDKPAAPRTHGRSGNRIAFGIALFGVIILSFVFIGLSKDVHPRDPAAFSPTLSARPSPALSEAITDANPDDLVPFVTMIGDQIRAQGYVTVTIHVGLADQHVRGVRRGLNNGDDPFRNIYFGARYGLETFFANDASWHRAFEDQGDREKILRRVIFRKTAMPTPEWLNRGIDTPFEVYVLMNAWSSTELVAAMQQPLWEARCESASTMLMIDGKHIGFGSESVIVGYVGRNQMLDEYWDPSPMLASCHLTRQIGVFYACPRSAVVLHAPIIRSGLYSVLFARTNIVPEGYLVNGMLNAMLLGEFDDGFTQHAANAYIKYQKSVSSQRAAAMLIR